MHFWGIVLTSFQDTLTLTLQRSSIFFLFFLHSEVWLTWGRSDLQHLIGLHSRQRRYLCSLKNILQNFPYIFSTQEWSTWGCNDLMALKSHSGHFLMKIPQCSLVIPNSKEFLDGRMDESENILLPVLAVAKIKTFCKILNSKFIKTTWLLKRNVYRRKLYISTAQDTTHNKTSCTPPSDSPLYLWFLGPLLLNNQRLYIVLQMTYD